MLSKRNNIKFSLYNNGNEIVDDFFESLLLRYQGSLETSMKETVFIFDSVQLMCYKFRKVKFRR